MKEEHLDIAKFIFKGSEVKITKHGQRHLGAAIGSKELKGEYIESKVNKWNDQLVYLKLLKWNLKQHMELLLGASRVSLRNLFKQLLIFMNVFNL